jgi:hypothetical protein
MDKKQADDMRHAMAQAIGIIRHATGDVGPAFASLASIIRGTVQSAVSAGAGATTLEEWLRRFHESEALAELHSAIAATAQAEESGE